MEDGGVWWCDEEREVLVCAENEVKSVGFEEERCYVWKK